MSEESSIGVLIDEIDAHRQALLKIFQFYSGFRTDKLDFTNPSVADAIVISDCFVNYYTCLETVFFRISQFFENSLDKEKWHSDLLGKMTLRIEGIRERAVSDKSYPLLIEFKNFRHFKRYYFSYDYDWDKLNFLMKKFAELDKTIGADLDNFRRFLSDLKNA